MDLNGTQNQNVPPPDGIGDTPHGIISRAVIEIQDERPYTMTGFEPSPFSFNLAHANVVNHTLYLDTGGPLIKLTPFVDYQLLWWIGQVDYWNTPEAGAEFVIYYNYTGLVTTDILDNYPLMEPWGSSTGPVHNIDTGEYFETIQAAINDADTSDGHTIEVAIGTYCENVVLNKTLNLVGEDMEKTIIDGCGGNFVIYSQYPWINISGFTIKNALYYGVDIRGHYYRASNLTVENCSHGIHATFSVYHTIEHCIIRNNTYGIYARLSYYGTIRNCRFENNTYYAIILDGGEGQPHSYSIYYNSFWFNNGATTEYDSSHVQAADVWPLDYVNYWDDTTGHGNYWCDWTGPDNDGNGIVDFPYTLDYAFSEAISRDYYPLAEPWTPPLPEFNISLNTGWNLLSIPLAMADTSIESVLSSISGNWSVAKCYDGTTKTWKTYRPIGTQTFTTIDNTMGVWLRATENCTLTVNGAIPTSTGITLKAGWNLVGYPSDTPRLASEILPPEADIVSVYQTASPYIQDFTDLSLVTMSAGNGYWVHATTDVIWAINW